MIPKLKENRRTKTQKAKPNQIKNQKYIEKQHDNEHEPNHLRDKKSPDKMTITPENIIEYTSEIEDNTDKQNEKTNKKRQVNQHLINNQNITQRKNKPQKFQNNTNKELYWIDNLPPDLTVENYATLNNKEQKHSQSSNTKYQSSQNITVIKETPISQQPAIKENEIDFLTPPIISRPYQSSPPDLIDTFTPTVTQK